MNDMPVSTDVGPVAAADDAPGNPPGWRIWDQTDELTAMGYGSLKQECQRLGIPVVTAMAWVKSGKVRGGVAGRIFGSTGVLLVHVVDLEERFKRKGEIEANRAEAAQRKAAKKLEAKARREEREKNKPKTAERVDRPDDPVPDGLVLLSSLICGVHVDKRKVEAWIQSGELRGALLFHGGRQRWFVDPVALRSAGLWYGWRKQRKSAEKWRDLLLGGGVAPDWVYDLFEKVAKLSEECGRGEMKFPDRPPQPVDSEFGLRSTLVDSID